MGEVTLNPKLGGGVNHLGGGIVWFYGSVSPTPGSFWRKIYSQTRVLGTGFRVVTVPKPYSLGFRSGSRRIFPDPTGNHDTVSFHACLGEGKSYKSKVGFRVLSHSSLHTPQVPLGARV